MTALQTQGQAAQQASRLLSVASTRTKNQGLKAIAQALVDQQEYLLTENAKDIELGIQKGMSRSLLDRLTLTPARIRDMAEGVRQVMELDDPVGQVVERRSRPNGLKIEKRRVPLGVVGIIYEARPNVTVDAAVLCVKSGNSVILRGGKEAFYSNCALVKVLREALEAVSLPADCVSLVMDTTRESAKEMMELTEYLDVLIPRGGAGLIRAVVEGAKVPVIETGSGVCHVYVDLHADLDMALNILDNGKTSRPSVCNAVECVLVHQKVAETFLPMVKARLGEEKGVQLRGCTLTKKILETGMIPATAEDWDTEYGDFILAVRVVEHMDDAIKFIHAHGTGHSEAIITKDEKKAEKFLNQVDAAAVYVNASTRFTDGFEFGLGAEIGISTQKMHARGPMGLEELTSCKFVVYGEGQIRM